jgi:hypothetical protein
MHIAPVTSPTTTTPPGRLVYQRHMRDLMSLPGVQALRWSRDAPDAIELRLANDGFRRLADNVLRDVVDGVRLILTVDPNAPAPVPGGDAWADSPMQMARAVAAMPGIVDVNASSEHGIHTLTFTSYEKHVVDRLRPLISPRLGHYSVGFWARSLPKPPAAT